MYIVKHAVSGKYWNGAGEWVSDIFKARQYSSLDGLNILDNYNAIPMIAELICKPIPKEEPIVYEEFDILDAEFSSKEVANICRYATEQELLTWAMLRTSLNNYQTQKVLGKRAVGNPKEWISLIKQFREKYA